MSRGPTGADGIDDHRRQPLFAHQIQHRPLGQEFRALVGADEVRLVGRRGLVGRRAVAGHAQRGDRTAVHDALDPRCLRRTHHRDRAVDIGAQHRPGIGHPEPVIGRDVEHVAAAVDGRAPARRHRSGRPRPARRPARPGCAGRWSGGPAGAAGGREPPAPARRRSRRSRSRRSAVSARPLPSPASSPQQTALYSPVRRQIGVEPPAPPVPAAESPTP